MDRKKLQPIMFVGTSSGVGKSTLAAGFCRIFLQDGFRPAPFKAQNMSLNSFVTPEGGEIGRAQAVQAEAAGVPPHPDMNPVLLKPSGNNLSQVILRGKVEGNLSAREYFRDGKQNFFSLAVESYRRLEGEYSPIVLEGAGGISELNLKERDIVNLSMARAAGAAVYLVADIERGGVFASVYGTLELLTAEERSLISGIIINQFHGDITLFEDGRKILEGLAKVPVLGVVPHLENLGLDEEDSLDMEKYHDRPDHRMYNIAVLRLRHLSNYTDFALLAKLPGVRLYYTDRPEFLEEADFIILPGTKNTIQDLEEIHRNGCARSILRAVNQGKGIMGICGGYQMMGEEVSDPEGIESTTGRSPGLGLFPMRTTLTYPKVTRQVKFRIASEPSQKHRAQFDELTGYEIHMGRSSATGSIDPLFFARAIDTNETRSIRSSYFPKETQEPEGAIRGRVMGSYIHGCLDEPAIVSFLFNTILQADLEIPEESSRIGRENSYNRLAEHLRTHIDVGAIYREIT